MMVKHARRKYEGVVTVYRISIANDVQTTEHGNVPLCMSCSLPLLSVASVKIVKARLTAAPGRRSAIWG